MADLTQTRLLKRKANSIWLWPTSNSRFCSFLLRTAICFFLPRVFLAPQIPVNCQVSRGKDCVWLGMLQKDSNGEGLWQVSLRSNIPRPEKCNCMVAWDSIILKVRACTLTSGKINGMSRTICCTDCCFARTMLMESGVGRQVCYDSEVAWLGEHPPGSMGKVTGIFGAQQRFTPGAKSNSLMCLRICHYNRPI